MTDRASTARATGPTDVPPAQGEILHSVTPALLQVLGLFLVLGSCLAWQRDGDVVLGTPGIVIAAVVLLVAVLLAWRGEALLGFVVAAPWPSVTGVFLAVCALVVGALHLLPSVHLSVAWPPLAIVGAVTLLGPLLEALQHSVRQRRARRAAPERATAGSGGPPPAPRLFNTVLSFLVWQIPLAAVLLVVILLLVGPV
ncbi:hypothetical protein [Sanguibacter suaedae]|uniref:Uncharacterized protein n=1 Tax=Sanguibacter suaedae TaxID=2795737 RepID=A0A934IAL8_9MICO|nr:hypothetical protein [Sanguibacter suaedae]MBI9114413.1 hypothetical protein [Sanguibacter suaedae]